MTAGKHDRRDEGSPSESAPLGRRVVNVPIIVFALQGLPPLKGEATSLFNPKHGQASRVRALLEAARALVQERGFPGFSRGVPLRLDLQIFCRSGTVPGDGTNYLGGIADVLQARKTQQAHAVPGAQAVYGDLLKVSLYEDDSQLQEVHYAVIRHADEGYRVRILPVGSPFVFEVADLLRIAKRATQAGRVSLYRGQPNQRWPLQARVFRPDLQTPGRSNLEHCLTAEFRSRAPARYGRCPGEESFGEWLALMQHFGAPTRLLDWTMSILIAGYFASESCEEGGIPQAGKVFSLDALALNYLEYGARQIPDLSRSAGLAAGAFNLKRKRKNPASRASAVAVTFTHFDLRHSVQQAAFTLHSPPGAPLEHHPKRAQFLEEYIIPPDVKGPLRGDLSLLGIDGSTIFPDLDGLGRFLIESNRPYLGPG
jgi:hypothetical protein